MNLVDIQFSNCELCSLLQDDPTTNFINNIFTSDDSGHNSNDPQFPYMRLIMFAWSIVDYDGSMCAFGYLNMMYEY